jgi:hypothetical protein
MFYIVKMGGILEPTYSYYSKASAVESMHKQLKKEAIEIGYDERLRRHFVLNERGRRRYVNVCKRYDIFGRLYFECFLN